MFLKYIFNVFKKNFLERFKLFLTTIALCTSFCLFGVSLLHGSCLLTINNPPYNNKLPC